MQTERVKLSVPNIKKVKFLVRQQKTVGNAQKIDGLQR